jgi:hypothetical protein
MTEVVNTVNRASKIPLMKKGRYGGRGLRVNDARAESAGGWWRTRLHFREDTVAGHLSSHGVIDDGTEAGRHFPWAVTGQWVSE